MPLNNDPGESAMYWLIALWLVPITAFLWARQCARARLWQITGLALGSVISPAALGLYGLYFVGPILALLGLIALPIMMIHGGPGYELAIRLGLAPARTVLNNRQQLYIELLNGVIWSLVYGAIGWLIDLLRKRRNRRALASRAA